MPGERCTLLTPCSAAATGIAETRAICPVSAAAIRGSFLAGTGGSCQPPDCQNTPADQSTGCSRIKCSLAAGAHGPNCSKSSWIPYCPIAGCTACSCAYSQAHLQQADGGCPARRLRSPKYVRSRAKGDLVDDVIDVLSLRTVQHSVVGSVEKRGIR